MDDLVNLCVGAGDDDNNCRYTTRRSTLTRYPDSMLAAMFTSELDPSVIDDNGAYVMDRDGPIFRHVLNFLRQGKLILPEDFKKWELLASEADYYQIEALVEAVKAEKYRRVLPEEEVKKFEFIELTACVNVKYTYTGTIPLKDLFPLKYFFEAHSCGWFNNGVCTYTLNLPCPRHDFECNVHQDFESCKVDILGRGYRLKARSYTLNHAGVQKLKWTFDRPVIDMSELLSVLENL
ncbi:uncharacterized protein LOC119725023 [Patiria miniata]|uniref:BTB domain-containing protein n=1 Tax=Patiria miniata TaxID=46514 RepID=A0A913ZMN3_PATMI|nr:uncharacterized protein LOC119725023 [Patiria miniata]